MTLVLTVYDCVSLFLKSILTHIILNEHHPSIHPQQLIQCRVTERLDPGE